MYKIKIKIRLLVAVNTGSQSKFISLARVSMKNEMYSTHVLKGSYVPLVVVISYLPIGVQRFDQSLLYQKYTKHFFFRLPHVFCIRPWDNYYGRQSAWATSFSH